MKRLAVAVIGCVLLLVGVALLVLPGPGFVLIAGALARLATQFEWAKRPLDYAKDKASVGIEEVATSKFRASLAVVCALGMVAIGVVELAGVRLPHLNALTAVMLILSGLFLVGTLVYAVVRARSNAAADEPSDH